MRKLKFWLVAGLSLIILLCVVAFGWLRSSLPVLDGEITLKGPSAAITIIRDKQGVPHISAESDNDLYFGAGYVHAQDRLWQMEMNRRIGHGKVAEVVGEPGLAIDGYMRTLGFPHKAQSAYDALTAETKNSLQAYADGVNAYLETRRGALPPEFILTSIEPEPWHPVDTLVWQKMMWLSLSGNMRQELGRARLLSILTPEQVASIYPDYPGDSFPALPALADLYDQLPLKEIAALVGPEKQSGHGSNNWVVDGAHTKSGMPLLANDPHLGLTTPSIWYLIHLHNSTEGTNLVGVGFPGTPSIVLGRNDHIAWGFTNTAPDIQDLFVEKLVDENTYLTPTGPAPFELRTERIKVRDAEDEILTVRETRHGPVISDIIGDQADFIGDKYVLALQWTALHDTDTAVDALISLGKAKTFADFKKAASLYLGPQQNMIYADTAGNIGYFAPALVPVRHPDNKLMGRIPSPGWNARYDWQGFIPYEELPIRHNPDIGIIATANEKIVDDSYPHFITNDWDIPYRGNRIRSELHATAKHDLESFGTLHMDTVSDRARDIVPVLKTALKGTVLPDGADILFNWDGNMAADRPEPLIFYHWLRRYQEALIADEIGDLYSDFRRLRPRLIKSSLYWSSADRPAEENYFHIPALDQNNSLAWCDNITTEESETCNTLAEESLKDTFTHLSNLYGTDISKWRWGQEHVLHQTHRPLSQVPVLQSLFEISSPIGGGNNTVNVAGVSQNPATLHQSTFGPSYRGLFDLSDLEKSLYAHPTGQSGNPFSQHFDDLFPLWRDGEYFTISTKTLPPEDTKHMLTLLPERKERP